MPRKDPVPSPRHSTIRRFWRIFRLLAALSVIIAALAVVLVTRGEGEIHASLIIATALGIGLTVLLGSGLMALMTQRRIRHLPVVEGGKIRGIVSIGDLVKHRMERIEAEADAMRAYIQSA